MGAPGTPLTDDQRDLINANLAEVAGEFHAAVLAGGRSIPADAMEGQTFSGKQAQRFNLAGMRRGRAPGDPRGPSGGSGDTGGRNRRAGGQEIGPREKSGEGAGELPIR